MSHQNETEDEDDVERGRLIEEIIFLKNEIKLVEKKLRIYESSMIGDNNGNRVIDIHHKMRILNDMKIHMPLVYNETVKNGTEESLFYHCDNIRFMYNKKGLRCPQWFREIYDDRMRQDDLVV